VVTPSSAILTYRLTTCDAARRTMEASPRSRVWTDADLAEHEPALRAAAAHLCRKAWETDDLVQDAFERALKFLSAGHPAPTHMRAWLVSIMRNAFIDRARKRVVEHAPVEDQAAPEAEDEPVWARVTTEEVRAALDRLDEDHRTIFELHYLDGMRYKDIAAKLGVPANTVGSKLFRVRKLLREELNKHK
jgi:RNA polymerase sigma factor (sigma-70 family)